MVKLGIGLAAVLLGTSICAQAQSAGTGQAFAPSSRGDTARWLLAEQKQPTQKAPQQKSKGSGGSRPESNTD